MRACMLGRESSMYKEGRWGYVCSRRPSGYCRHLQASGTYSAYEEVKRFEVVEIDEVMVMGAYARVMKWAFF